MRMWKTSSKIRFRHAMIWCRTNERSLALFPRCESRIHGSNIPAFLMTPRPNPSAAKRKIRFDAPNNLIYTRPISLRSLIDTQAAFLIGFRSSPYPQSRARLLTRARLIGCFFITDLLAIKPGRHPTCFSFKALPSSDARRIQC